ncbi:hypothetical protein [Paenibacillus sp. YPG26]|uniref:hypothetical protein n=1 Tax=Paenibacillus sp. YPG26 TaxID=2878915 RepID=UPI00320952A9
MNQSPLQPLTTKELNYIADSIMNEDLLIKQVLPLRPCPKIPIYKAGAVQIYSRPPAALTASYRRAQGSSIHCTIASTIQRGMHL